MTPDIAHADCALVPSGSRPEGAIIYNADNKVSQYCNGTDWIKMHPNGSGSGGCSLVPSGSRPEGSIIYNADKRVLQGCAGNKWMAMGPLGGIKGDDFVTISAGFRATCGLKSDGSAWCWGAGPATGSGNSTDQTAPVEVVESGPWSMIGSSGYSNQTCALKADGSAWCWGNNGNGALGIGTFGGGTI